jgi:hypothetical protein
MKQSIITRHPSSLKRQSGFILVATLWIVAGLTLLAGYIDRLTDNNVERAFQQQSEIREELDRLNTENTLIYLLSTNRMNHRGVLLEDKQFFSGYSFDEESPPLGPALELSGSVYEGLGEVRFSLLDEATLVSVNSPSFPALDTALRTLNINRARREVLLARLADYIDPDHSLSINGAELYEYRSKGIDPPSNFLLNTPLEMLNVLGFEKLLSVEEWSALKSSLSMRQALGYNFNLMRPSLISGVLGVNENVLRPLVLAREQESIRTIRQIEAVLGRIIDASLNEDEIRAYPSRFIRITTWRRNSRQHHLTGVEFTPFVDYSPWRKDYLYTEQSNEVATGQAKKAISPLLQ